MPITIQIVDHPAREWTAAKAPTPNKLLEEACPKQYRRCQRVVQTSFNSSLPGHVSASANGFVWAAYHAYSNHHHLIIRPEDVWFAILNQLGFFINGHSEELRTFFVEHQGQKRLEAISNIADFGSLAVQMAHLIAKNVRDPDLREWVMPSFSTTTDCDRVVGSVLFMGAMQKYFTYQMTVTCGLPSITLLGEVEDWKGILRRLDKIDLLGDEPSHFAQMLRPILRHMVLSFENPKSSLVLHFWNTIVHRNPVGSGTDYLSGWLTGFCFWDEEGRAKRPRGENTLFGDVLYPTVDVDSIPAGFASVPITVDNNGHQFEATLVAGSVGIDATASGIIPQLANDIHIEQHTSLVQPSIDQQDNTGMVVRDQVQPVSGWWIYENERPEKAEAREAEKKRLEEEIENISKEDTTVDDSEHWEVLIALAERLHELEVF